MIAHRSCSTNAPGLRDPIYSTCVPPSRYQSVHYHRPGAHRTDKSEWKISRDDECHTFCEATDRGWADGDGNRWYVDAEARELGTRGERVATYPNPNSGSTWHGFPISGVSGAVARRRVPAQVLRTWEHEQATTRGLLMKLWKRTV